MRISINKKVLTLIATVLAVMLIMPSVAPAQSQGQTIKLQFVSCPDGTGDENGPPASGCDTPVPAPETASIRVSAHVSEGLEKYATGNLGEYAIPAYGGSDLDGFYRPDFNYFTFTGAVDVTRWQGHINTNKGNEITVVYWNGPDGLIQPAENSAEINFFSCEAGVDARVTTDGCIPYSGEVPESMSILDSTDWKNLPEPTWSNGTLTYNSLPANTALSLYFGTNSPLPHGHSSYLFANADEVNGETGTTYLLRNEHRSIDVYLYSPEGTVGWRAVGTGDPGTVNLRLANCPGGTDPLVDDSACETIQDDGSGKLMTNSSAFGAENLPAPNANGTYTITAQGYLSLSGMEPVTSTSLITTADGYRGASYLYFLNPGETRDVTFYYMRGESAEQPQPTESTQPGVLRVTLATCEPGQVPESLEGLGNCTVIPDDGRGMVFIDGVNRPLTDYPQDESGAYVIETSASGVALSYLDSDNGWDYHAKADEIHGINYIYELTPGQSVEAWFYYTPPTE